LAYFFHSQEYGGSTLGSGSDSTPNTHLFYSDLFVSANNGMGFLPLVALQYGCNAWKDLPTRIRHCAILRALVILVVTPPI